MKRSYERPLVSVELFMANQAVSTCTVEGSINWTFDCMYGPKTDTANVISNQIPGVTGSCKLNIGYAAGILTARDYSSRGNHSNNNPSLAQWNYVRGSWGSDGYLQVTYSGGEGLLYTDGSPNTDVNVWSVEGSGSSGYVKHSSSRGGMHHMVAPVLNTQTINASW